MHEGETVHYLCGKHSGVCLYFYYTVVIIIVYCMVYDASNIHLL